MTARSAAEPRTRPGRAGLAPVLGAPPGGALAGPSPEGWLEALLRARPCGQIALAPSLLPRWEEPIRARGGQVSALEAGGLERAGSGPGGQVWLDLEGTGPAAPDPEVLDRWLEAVGSGPEPPLVVLLRDDAAARVRTHRLAVDRPGRVLLVREGASGGACALGRPALLRQLAAAGGWRPSGCGYRPRRPSGGHLMVLDVDGVLIDPGRAFLEAVAGALGDLAPDLAWGDEDYLRLKRAGGFNNDFRLAAAALALAERGGMAGPLPERRIRALEPGCRAAVRRHYARTRCLERPLVRPEHLAGFPGNLAVFTGRPPQELSSAFDLLGFRLPAVGDSAPHLRKPRPEGLIQLADAFRAGQVTFVGDSRDDASALGGARALRPEIHWTFAAVGADRARIAGPGDLLAPGLADLLGGWP